MVPVLLAGTPADLSKLVAHPRLGFTSLAFDDEGRRAGIEVPRRTGNFFLDNHEFFFTRIPHGAVNLIAGPVERGHNRYVDRKPMTQASLDKEIERLRERLAGYEANVERNLGTLARLIARWRALGQTELAFLDSPVNPRLRGLVMDEGTRRAHRERIARFAREHGVHHWSLAKSAALEPDDFYDMTHLRTTAAKDRYTRALAERLAGVLAGHRAAEPRS